MDKKTKSIQWIDIEFEDKDNKASCWYEINGVKMYLPHNWEIAIDLENGRYTTDKVDGYPTLNEFQANGGDVKLCFPYELCDSPQYEREDDFNPQDVVDFFAEHGYKVTLDAIKHNLLAWGADLKSGYRDEINGYHIFTPCGCNPLRFSLSTLHPSQTSWQTTYMC